MDGSGRATKESLTTLFVSENVYKAKEDRTSQVSQSLQSLQSDFGGSENLFATI